LKKIFEKEKKESKSDGKKQGGKIMDKTKEKGAVINVVRSQKPDFLAVLEQIISSAEKINDPCDFGLTVANILRKNELIAEAVYEILAMEDEDVSDY
jgi:hypothetical protein